jgi:serine beta-lactamase-like protein LACTB, mitochondrial
MNDSTFDDAAPVISNRHTPYSYINGELINSPSVNSSYKYAGGGFLSTPSDIVKMAIAHTTNDFLPAESVENMITPTAKHSGSNFGIGWLVGWDSYLNRLNRDKVKNKKSLEMIARHKNAVMHSGGSMGGVTMLILCLEHNHSAAVVKNVNGESSANVFNLALETLDLFTD